MAEYEYIMKMEKDMDGIECYITKGELIRCKDCKHYYFADNRIPQEQRYTCYLNGDRWKPDDFCSYAERRTAADMRGKQE